MPHVATGSMGSMQLGRRERRRAVLETVVSQQADMAGEGLVAFVKLTCLGLCRPSHPEAVKVGVRRTFRKMFWLHGLLCSFPETPQCHLRFRGFRAEHWLQISGKEVCRHS